MTPAQPHELARKYSTEIKESVAKRFSLNQEGLFLLSDDPSGVYLSEKQPDTLCCLLVDKENGHMYLFTAHVEGDGETLSDFKSDPIS